MCNTRIGNLEYYTTELMPYLCAGGNCNTVLVANIYGEAAQIDETVSRFLVAKSS